MLELSVCISSLYKRSTLKDSLESLFRQSVPFKVYVAVVGEKPFEDPRVNWVYVPQVNISQARNCLFRKAPGEVVYFLDDDCLLEDPCHLESLLKFCHSRSEPVLGFGGYVNSCQSPLWGRAYNFICNLWLNKGRGLSQGPHVLGGNFFICCGQKNELPFDESFSFGAEESVMVRRVRQQGMDCCYLPHLSVQHVVHGGLGRFLSRAWRHGSVRTVMEPEELGIFAKARLFLAEREGTVVKLLALLYLLVVYIPIRPFFKRGDLFQ